MSSAQRYPLSWPAGRPRTPAAQRKRASFGRNVALGDGGWTSKRSLTVAQAVDRLHQQIRGFTPTGRTWRCHPDTIVISSNLRTRNDGLPYSNAAQPEDPGVAVYLTLDGKPHCLACDCWDRVADNLAAIAKHIEATRGMERWGVANLAQMFQGFKELPGAIVKQAMTVEQAAAFVHGHAYGSEDGLSNLVCDQPHYRIAYRRAAAKLHPDAGGDHDDFVRLQEAKRVLDAHHNR